MTRIHEKLRPSRPVTLLLAVFLVAPSARAIIVPSTTPSLLTPAQIAERWSAGVVTLQVRIGSPDAVVQGTGFVLDSDGTIATCLHLLDGAEALRVRTGDGRSYREAVVRAFDAERDVALIRIEATDLTALPLGSSEGLDIGDDVVVIGNPLGLERTVSEGLLSAWREPAEDDPEENDDDLAFNSALTRWRLPQTRLLQISAAVTGGSSGAPVFDRRGEVVGMAFGYMAQSSNLSFAIPVEALEPLLDVEMGLDLASFQEQADEARQAMSEPLLDEARLELELGRIEEAERTLAQALILHPRSVDGLLMRADLLHRRSDYDGMEEVLLEATRVGPESAEAWYELGKFYLPPTLESATIARQGVVIGGTGGPRARDKAMSALRRALEIDEEHPGANRAMGSLLYSEGNAAQAARMLRRAVASEPDLLIAGFQLGEVYLALGRIKNAERVLEDVLDQDDDYALAHYGMARVRSEQYGELAAREHWRRFLELSEGDPDLEALRARTLRDLARYFPEALPRR